MKKLLLIFVTIVFIACKSEKKPEKTLDEKESVIENNKKDKEILDMSDGKFRILFEGVFEEDDLLLLYYSNEAEQQLTTKKSIRKQIKGSPNPQKIVVIFPAQERPYNIRIDFSDNKKQKYVKLKSLVFLDAYNKAVINSDNIDKYFNFNNKMTFDKQGELLIGEVYKINDKEAYNPYFVANKAFIEVLTSLNAAAAVQKTVNLIDDIYNINLDDGKFRMILKGTFKSDDLVIVFFAEDSLDKFNLEETVRQQVKGSEHEQTIIFTFPEDAFIAKIKLDISDRKQQEQIVIHNIIFAAAGIKVEIDKLNLSKYFFANNYIDFNKETGYFSCKIIKENGVEKYNPYFISSPELVKELLSF